MPSQAADPSNLPFARNSKQRSPAPATTARKLLDKDRSLSLPMHGESRSHGSFLAASVGIQAGAAWLAVREAEKPRQRREQERRFAHRLPDASASTRGRSSCSIS
jgi:hypothetical protein